MANYFNKMLTVIIGSLNLAQRRLKQGFSGSDNGDVARHANPEWRLVVGAS